MCPMKRMLFIICTLFLFMGHVFSQIERPGSLIRGVCWAKCNVDKPGTFVATREEFGMLYQWEASRGWIATNFVTGGDTLISAKDPCPVGWRMPTVEETKSLRTGDGVGGSGSMGDGLKYVKFMTLTSEVFFPIFKFLPEENPIGIPKSGYWSDSEDTSDPSKAWAFFFIHIRGVPPADQQLVPRDYPLLVRCVADEKCDSIVTHDTVTICSTDLPYEWNDTTFLEGTKTGTYCLRFRPNTCGCMNIAYLHLTVEQESEKSCPGVLINDVCWAEYNVDEPGRFANPGKPYGMLYQWNRKKGWPAITPDSVSGWNSSLDPGGTWEPANDPCPAGWRMPSVEEIRLLTDKAKVTYTEQVGQDGALGSRYTDIVTGNMLFLPITGYRDAQGIRHNVLWIHYWSSTDYWSLDRNSIVQAPYAYGYSVRCVADENACDIVLTASETICKEALPYTWHDTTFREGTVTGEYCIRRTNPVSRCDTIFYLYLTVDTLCGKPCKERGVFINGVCWAESNVDNPNTFADTPEAFGLLYQWNRKKGYSLKEDIDPDDWKLYDSYVRWEAANNPCPADWRIPTIGEIYTLLDDLKVTREWGQQNGVYGMRFTDKLNGNTVFLPPAGRRSGATASYQDDNSGWYWSSTVYAEKSVWALLFMDETFVYTSYFSPGAYSVRCVAGRDTTEDCGVVTDTSVSVCANDLPYEWCDTTFDVGTKSGTYRFQYISAVTGCDSIVNLHLTVHASDTSFFDAVCYGDDYNDYGFSLPVVYRDTILHDTLQSVWGCDSVRTLHLTVNPEYHTSLYDTVCRGASYNRYGFSLSDVQTDRDYTLSLSSQAGCDSILTLHLTVHPVYDTTLYDTICQGNFYSNYGFDLPSGTSGGTFTKTYSTVHGCDSVVTLHLHVHPVYLFSATQNICQGDTFDFRGRKLYKSGVYYDSLTTIHGCDSIYCLTLSVHPSPRQNFSGVVCSGSSYNDHGFNLSAVTVDTIVRDTFKTRWGCDSIRTLYLTVHSVYDTTLYDTICQGNSYSNYGFSLPSGTSGGTFTNTYSTVHGCDSTVTLNLHVHPVYLFSETQHICQGDSISFRGRWLHTSGVYYDSLTTVHGCDSVYRLKLTVHPSPRQNFSGVVCSGSSYNNHGFNLSAVTVDTIVRDTFKTRWGCDSIRTLYLTVYSVYDTTLYDTICQGGSYSNYGFSLPGGTSGGTFTKTYSTIHGCDSVVTLHLHVWPKSLYTYAKDICQGDTFDFRGRKLYKSGVYYDSLTTVHGCDSIYRLTLSVHSTSPLLFPDKVCYGSGYNKYGFSLPSVYHDTLVRDTFRSFWGCDSIRILSLSVQPVYDTPLYDTVCQGDGYYRHGFTLPSVQVDGVHTLTLSSRSGCDSTLILHLKVHPVYNTVLYDSICPSDYYERYGFRLSNLHESSTYRRTELTVHGCDSTVTLYLHVWPTYFYPETVHLCEGDTFDFRGMRYHESGEYYDSLTTTKGCDSIYCLYLSVHPVYDIQLCGVLCEGIPYTQGGFHVSTPGLHYQYLQSAFGCDSTVTLTLTEEKKIEGSIRVLLEDCSTHGYSFFFDPGDMINHWEWDLGDGTLLRSEECYHQYSDSGTYRIQLHAETYNECENRFSYVQRVPPYLREVVIHSDRQVIDEDYPTVHFRTEVFPGMRCLWDFGDGERGEGDRVSHTYNARTEKYYEVRLQVLNSDSCVTESRMDIEVVFLPKALNTFSPNGDGINDVFMPDYVIEIMDRNGLRIYSGASGWDGTYNGRQAKEDTYFYRLHYRTANGKRQKTGYVTLIR